ncbi:NADPH-dependent oxidoreductase [Bombilactobacillus folatiphilus]|uniref:NADPH-dependent oxidoreductase n=1 Tax=Bombilactobacillus folatiphilus TaxID=2923362 RepID=A0ABY4P7B6_9LACO|nr:NADPH-dependent oxidoreductase [Bombilactobacillus folatiphilus]UQS81527.1 NADPH-dependent oxidoreductase [Bombilactobacillus folatiphilus]
MNELVARMANHASVRQFKDQPLSTEIKQELLTAAQSGASSNFVQAWTVLEINDKAVRSKLGQLAHCEPYVLHSGVFYVFIADLYRQKILLEQHHQDIASLRNLESLLVSVVDTTISAQNMVIAAEQMGLGICYIGGLRNDLFQVKQLLTLPELTVPLFGLTIGEPLSQNEVKPRLPQANQVAIDVYPRQQFTDLSAYDQITGDYYQNRTQNNQQTNWSQKNLAFFKEIRRPEVSQFIKKQGFVL